MCQSKKLSSERPVRRQIIDLKFSGAAVERWVVLYLSREYRCKKCGAKFIPDGFPKIRSKFGKGLVIWCAYQMVIGGQNMSRSKRGLRPYLGLGSACLPYTASRKRYRSITSGSMRRFWPGSCAVQFSISTKQPQISVWRADMCGASLMDALCIISTRVPGRACF